MKKLSPLLKITLFLSFAASHVFAESIRPTSIDERGTVTAAEAELISVVRDMEADSGMTVGDLQKRLQSLSLDAKLTYYDSAIEINNDKIAAIEEKMAEVADEYRNAIADVVAKNGRVLKLNHNLIGAAAVGAPLSIASSVVLLAMGEGKASQANTLKLRDVVNDSTLYRKGYESTGRKLFEKKVDLRARSSMLYKAAALPLIIEAALIGAQYYVSQQVQPVEVNLSLDEAHQVINNLKKLNASYEEVKLNLQAAERARFLQERLFNK